MEVSFDVVSNKNRITAQDRDNIYKILAQELEREKLYPADNIFQTVSKELNRTLENEAVGKILGRILDKTQLAEQFIELVPLYFDEAGNWWKWDSIEYYWKIVDETDILCSINKAAEVNVINSKEKTEILNALKLRARSNAPKEISKRMIQFRKQIVDLETGEKFTANPKYFVTNPIPFKLGKSADTSKFDKLFKEWVNTDENVRCLYEILAFGFIPEYIIERIFVLLGGGANGKSTFLKIACTLWGMKNICTSSLDTLLKSRFETVRLYKKLACILAETNLSSLENSQLIKRLVSGKDPVPIEFKNKGLLDFVNYAKIIIATNNLPPTDDKQDGFYRRWRIIPFPNQFEKEVDVLADITTEDYENLASKCLNIADDLLKNRQFTGDGNIAERKKAYEEKSNPFDKFWTEYVDDSDPNADIPCWEFEKEVNEFMKANHVRNLSDRAIAKLMKDKGIQQSRKRVEWYENNEAVTKHVRVWGGVKWKK